MSTEQRRLTLRRTMNASAADVFAAFLSADAITHWWAPAGHAVLHSAVDARVGGRYRLETQAPDGASRVSIHGVFREIDPPRRLVFTHTFEQDSTDEPLAAAGLIDYQTLVTVELRVHQDGTEVVLVQEKIPSVEAEGVLRHGWESILDRLGAYVTQTGRNAVS
jgi:uncharacterized protein YndB with AHSA1/START domain